MNRHAVSVELYDWPRWRWVTLAKHFTGELLVLERDLGAPVFRETSARWAAKALAVEWLRSGRIAAADVAAAWDCVPRLSGGWPLSIAEATSFAERINRSAVNFEVESRANFEEANASIANT